MTKSLRVGIVGAGLIGKKRALGLPKSCKLIGITDINRNAAATLSAQLGSDVLVADNLDQLLELNLDLVIVATTHVMLPIIASAALKAGCHVLIEKPGANELGPLTEIKQIAERSGLKVQVGFNHRFHPAFIKAQEIVQAGEYGKLLWIRARYGHGGRLGYEQEWRADKSISGGGELLDQGSHLIDLTRMLVGDLSLEFSEIQTSFWKMNVEDNAFLALRPSSGGFAWLHASWTEWKNTFSFEISLERAKIDVSGLGGSYGQEMLTLYRMQPEMGPPPYSVWTWEQADDSWSDELSDFVNYINGGIPRGATIDDAIAVHAIIGEVYSK